MSAIFELIEGSVPLLISMPHNGEQIPDDIASTMTPAGHKVADTDWYKDRLYDFAEAMGAYIIKPNFSRYVVDLNRDPSGENLYPGANSTELCPTTAFDLSALYQEGKLPSADEVQRRVSTYWQPYHNALADTLARIREQHGVAVLLEAHSIMSHVPRFFEGQLPDFNFGTASGDSCADALIKRVESLDFAPYSQVTNGRFKGGFITRHYGDPKQNIHALQLELSQATYMIEENHEYDKHKADLVKPKLEMLVTELLKFAGDQK